MSLPSRRRPARETRPPSQVAAVSSSRCASSNTTASCSGSTPPPGREVGEVERVVRDHELGLRGASLRRLGEARREQRAAAPGAAVGADGELGPQRVGGLERQLRAVAGLGLGDPRLQLLPGGLVARVAEQHRPEALQLLAAEVVLAALEHHDVDLAPERPRGRRHLARRAAAPEAPSSRWRRPRGGPTRAPEAGRRGSSRFRCRPRPAGARPWRARSRPHRRAQPARAGPRSREGWRRGRRPGRTPRARSEG